VLAKVWGEEEAKTDAEQMTDVINEVSVSEEILEKEYDPPDEPTAQVAPKAKANELLESRLAAELEIEVKETHDEVQAVVSIPVQEESKEVSKVACPDCGKQMSAKTLRYSHGPNCTSKKQKQQSPREQPARTIMDDAIESEVRNIWNSRRAEGATPREAMVQN
jgi:hypothetical protein